MMIVTVVIERLVSLIVPAAGAVLAVAQGLMAAWGTISKIIAAIGAFIAFVKAVKAGPAACLFTTGVAAGVVALLEFITNFLMAKLAGAAKGVGGALKGMAQKIMKGLAQAGKGARKAAGGAVNRARKGMQKVGAALKPKAKGPKPGRPAKPARPGRPGRPGKPGAKKPASPLQDVINLLKEDKATSLRRTQKGKDAASKFVKGEIPTELPSSSPDISKHIQNEGQWTQQVAFLDKFFRGKYDLKSVTQASWPTAISIRSRIGSRTSALNGR